MKIKWQKIFFSDKTGSYSKSLVVCFLVSLTMFSCSDKQPLFTALDKTKTGINFQNTINETDSFNILDYLYFYNGGGVAVGDINNDGLQDIYFSSNQESNKLYLNRGNMKFEDITIKAGVAGKGNWKTGVTMVDVNGDGLLDIYVCEVGNYKNLQGRNELFINNGLSPSPGGEGPGEVTFTESASEYGLDVEGFNTQASFFDYDKDGDLDMFLVNHSVHSTATYVDAKERTKTDSAGGDKLFRCDRDDDKIFFTEVTKEAGIFSSVIGYGLNVIVGDFNNDNWDDVYVSNDFHENDYYYINNQNGTFSEQNAQAFGHQSKFSMGSDAGDINNDGWLDIISLDMLPQDEKVLKSSVSDDPLDIYEFKMSKGYHHQYSRNCLQLNVDGGKHFSDIALFAGVAATDWSWSPLLADFDNDGIKDLFITNGVLRRPNDLDYLKFISSTAIAPELQKGRSADQMAIQQMPEGKVANYMFSGTRELQFIDQSGKWGLNEPSFSNGAAYADLDNDGDLDLVVNNINSPAGVYQNNSAKQLPNHYLQVQLTANSANAFAYGSKVIVKNKGTIQLQYVTATRGFESSSPALVHFGLGGDAVVDTVQVIWPDGKVQNLANVAADQRLKISYDIAAPPAKTLLPDSNPSHTLFLAYTDSLQLAYKHEENNFVDFNMQQLIPQQVSTQGPKMAVGDINGDGLDDFFICGAKGQAGKLFQQTKEGKFTSVHETIFLEDLVCEDVDALFFDADGDGDNDLYVVSGGNERDGKSKDLLDRLYLNNGQKGFSRSDGIPPIYENKSVAAPADVDRDGDVDLFVGARVVAGNYGLIPKSYLLLNNGKGIFAIAPDKQAPGLQDIGMVTGAAWTDIDKDGWPDLVLVGEWMPITVYKNVKGFLQNHTKAAGLENTTGLWTSLVAADLDNDGFDDLLAGNRGENSKLQASEQFPLHLYVGDIDNNGATDQVLAVAKGGTYYPFLGKEELEKVVPGIIRKKFLDYKSMAGQPVQAVFGNSFPSLKKLSSQLLASVMIQNDKGKLSVVKLPASVQWSPVFSFLTGDFNSDGKTDIAAGGNFYGVLPYEGRYDASYGNVLLSGDSSFTSLLPYESGLMLEGEIRDCKKIRTSDGEILYAFARNNNSILFYKVQEFPKK